jgi:uncharacterized iron-regulated membrane protein
VLQVHLWTGVAIGLYVIAVCLSGVMLVFADDLQNDIPSTTTVPRNSAVSYQSLVARAQSEHPGEVVGSVDGRRQDRGYVVLYMGDEHTSRLMYMDVSTGTVLADVVPARVHPFMTFIRELHGELLGGHAGGLLNGAGALLLLLMCLTGLVIAWPGYRSWRRAFKVQWNASWARLNWDLHSALGLWTLVLTAMWAITGAYFIFPQPFRQAIRTLSTAPEKPSGSGWHPGDAVLDLDAFVAKAHELYPASRVSFLTLALRQPDGYVDVLLSRNPEVPTTILRDEVFFHPATGKALGSESSAHWTVGYALCYWAFDLHLGDFAGLASKVLWAILGCVPVALVVTGYLIWWNRVLKKYWLEFRNHGKTDSVLRPLDLQDGSARSE